MRRILVKSEVCSGCRACEIACTARHEGGFGTALGRIKVTKIEPEGFDVPAVCRLCRRPGCAQACPTGALWSDADLGVVRLQPEKCMGCGACAEGCPFGMVTMRSSDSIPLICDLCDGDPACVKRCATGAITWGHQESLLQVRREGLALRVAGEAKRRRPGPRAAASASDSVEGEAS